MNESPASRTAHAARSAPWRRGETADPELRRRADFEAFARAVHGPVTRYVRRRAGEEADDVVAETLLVAWRRFEEIPVGAELPWCYGVARRCLANQRRGEARRLRLVDAVARQPARPEPVDGAHADPELGSALAVLDDADRELLRLWAWEGLAPREIAVVLGVSANAASIRLHRARRRLEAELARSGRKDPDGAGHIPPDDTRGDGR